ncbi:MAG: phosphatase PAP2 family protein [Gemmatimonadota bacterium]|nr:phosphatase PAP2 family protein [Gemmatimonadota bacterium]
MYTIDVALFHWINGFAGRWASLDLLMIGTTRYSPIIFAVVLLACWARWRPAWQRGAALAGVAALLALGFGQLGNLIFPRARPFVVTAATVLVPHAGDSSFPSDHAILAFAVTIVLATVNRTLGAMLGAFGMLVLISRVFVGAHYPTDVIGGAAVGALGAWITLRAARVTAIGRIIDAVFALLRRAKLAAPIAAASDSRRRT